MFGPEEQNAPNIAIITLVLGWVFALVTMLSLAGLVCARHMKKISLRIDDYLLFVAFVIAIALAAHTTWTVVDEGLATQQEVAGGQRRATLVKVILIFDA